MQLFVVKMRDSSLICSTKTNNVFDNVVSIYLRSWRLNDVVRLTIFCTTDLWLSVGRAFNTAYDPDLIFQHFRITASCDQCKIRTDMLTMSKE